jgi:hypothetical protein
MTNTPPALTWNETKTAARRIARAHGIRITIRGEMHSSARGRVRKGDPVQRDATTAQFFCDYEPEVADRLPEVLAAIRAANLAVDWSGHPYDAFTLAVNL